MFGNIGGTVEAFLQARSHINLMQTLFADFGPSENNIILYIQGALSTLCQMVTASGSLDSMFTSPTLQTIVHIFSIIPDTIEMLVNGYFNENLHRFLVHHQIPTLIQMFPAPVCARTDILESYLNLTMRQKMVIKEICTTDWANITTEFMMEMIPMETHIATMSGHRFNLSQAWDSAGCVAFMAMSWNWTSIMEWDRYTRSIDYLIDNLEEAGRLLPRTITLLQLYLQPYLQHYPAFRDFPELYKQAVEVLEGALTGSMFDSIENSLKEVDHVARFIQQFVNVDGYHDLRELLEVKPWLGEFLFFLWWIKK